MKTIFSLLCILPFAHSSISQIIIANRFYSPLNDQEFYAGTPKGNMDSTLNQDNYGIQYPQPHFSSNTKELKLDLDELLIEISLLPKDAKPKTKGRYKGIYHLTKSWRWNFSFRLESSQYSIEKGADVKWIDRKETPGNSKEIYTYDNGKYAVVLRYSEWIGNSSSMHFDAYFYRKRMPIKSQTALRHY